MLAHAFDLSPIGTIVALGLGGIVVAVAIVRGLLAVFVEWADGPESQSPPDSSVGIDRSHHADVASEVQLRKDWPPLRVVDREVRR